MPKKVARELIRTTPKAKREQFARELARRRGRRNPEAGARQVFEGFHQTKASGSTTFQEKRHYHSFLGELGRLIEFEVFVEGNGPDTLSLVRLDFKGSGERNGVMVGSTEDRGQIYFLGGDQALDLARLRVRGLPKDHVEIGLVWRIVYLTRKGFDDLKLHEYEHEFGEDDKKAGRGNIVKFHTSEGAQSACLTSLPRLDYSVRDSKIYLVGGRYKVNDEGIVN